MRFASGPLSVEVQLAVRDNPLVEYDEEEVGAHDRSCYVGIQAGQRLQINMTFSGPWNVARCDIVIDGVLCRVVSVKGPDPIWKFVDQVCTDMSSMYLPPAKIVTSSGVVPGAWPATVCIHDFRVCHAFTRISATCFARQGRPSTTAYSIIEPVHQHLSLLQF